MKKTLRLFVYSTFMVIAGFVVIAFAQWILMLLWNDVTPLFGVDIQLTFWQVVKFSWLVTIIGSMLKGFSYTAKKKS